LLRSSKIFEIKELETAGCPGVDAVPRMAL
jgi:hypothetical protein